MCIFSLSCRECIEKDKSSENCDQLCARFIHMLYQPTSFISLQSVCMFILPFRGNITMKTAVKTQMFEETKKKTHKKKENMTTVLYDCQSTYIAHLYGKNNFAEVYGN